MYVYLNIAHNKMISKARCPQCEDTWVALGASLTAICTLFLHCSRNETPPLPRRGLPTSTPSRRFPPRGGGTSLAPFFYHSSLYFRMQIILHTCENRNHCSRSPLPSTETLTTKSFSTVFRQIWRS